MGCELSKNKARGSSTPSASYKPNNAPKSFNTANLKWSENTNKENKAATRLLKEGTPESQKAGAVDTKVECLDINATGNKQKKKPPFVRDKFDPRVLQKYEIKALIGRGSFSKVC